MKRFLLPGILSVLLAPAMAQAPPAPYGALPSKAQLKWHETEMYCIIHFGMNTYTNKEWGYGDENPAIVNPVRFNATQIVNAAKAGGFKGIVMVAKHHDGFCLWPTATTPYNISKSSWKNGKGDLVKDYRNACDAAGLRLGLYCSPWDRNSAVYGDAAYVQLYRSQLRELYTNYGALFMSWHDGANGGDGYYGGARTKRTIDRTTYYGWDTTWAITRRMQPSAAIFGDIGPDVRWVGNEEGIAGETCWATYTPLAPDSGKKPSNGYSKYWEATEGTRNGVYWMPAECDVPLRPGWFYHQAQDGQVKSPAVLLDLYYKSVGRGACLDLGLAPNQEGRLHENDIRSLAQFGELLQQTFAVNLLKGARFTASNTRGKAPAKYGAAFLTDNDRYSYWATDDTVLHPQLIADLGKQKTFNVIRLRENIRLGQRINSLAVDSWENNQWKEIATATSIGSNRLIKLPTECRTNKVRLRITGAACIALSDFGLFKESLLRGENKNTAVSKQFSVSKKGWRVTGVQAESQAAHAIDEKEQSFYHAPIDSSVAVDMGKLQTIAAFTYLPRQDKRKEGLADQYAYFTSTDGVHWTQVAIGEFANIAANPIEQVTRLDRAVQARYFKVTALHVISGSGISVAELGALEK
jgi:alpha-L-fucosidase